MVAFVEEVRRAIRGQRPLVYIHSGDEARIERALERLSAEIFPEEPDPCTWSCVSGLTPFAGRGDSRDPVVALRAILGGSRGGLFVLKDLSAFLHQPGVERALRDAYYALSDRLEKVIVILAPDLVLPERLRNELVLVEPGPPDGEELLDLIRSVRADDPGGAPPEAWDPQLVAALRGLSWNDVRHVLRQLGTGERETVLEEIHLEKRAAVKKAGLLEYVPPAFRVDDIGGLENIKDWMKARRGLFTQEAQAKGLPVPKGILLMGVSGCGKSFAAKATSALWDVPLFRLDMNLVFSGLYGTPEGAFDRALRTLEAVSPVVVWIDEIENGLSMVGEGGNSQSHLFSAFLTWLQEKPPLVFVAATANRIALLPAELLRKGRFDQVFFCDLPHDEERRQIIEIHLRRNGADPEEFRVDFLVVYTKGWSGAEIEQAIVSARVDAVAEDRPFTTADVINNAERMVPLSQTMHEQIRALREWSCGRATPASRDPERKEGDGSA